MIAAFALIDDGVPALILEEERFNREKHTQEFPRYVVEPHAMPPRTRDQCRQVRCPLQSFRPRPSVVGITIEQDQRRLRLTWQERGGPLVKVPDRKGFGSLLIELTGQGNTSVDFRPDGVSCLLELPL